MSRRGGSGEQDRAALWALMGLGLALRVWIALAPLERLVAVCLSDDAFYYHQIARHLLAGRGATFDGVIPTNGFHPLFLLALLPLHTVSGRDPFLPVHLSLLFLSVCSVATAWPLVAIVRRFASGRAALLAALFWLFNPWSVFIGLTGVEAALAVFLLALTAAWAMRLLEDKTHGGGEEEEQGGGRQALALRSHAMGFALLGVLAGLTILARTDMVLALLPLGVGVAVRCLRRTPARPRAAGRLLLAAGCAGVVVLPWVTWNLTRFGTIWQTSGRTLLFRAHSQFRHFNGESVAATLGHAAGQVRTCASRWLLDLAGLGDPRTPVFLALILLASFLVYRLVARESLFRRAAGLAEVALGLGALWLFYAGVFWQTKSWYFLPTVFGLALLAGAGVGAVEGMVLSRKSAMTRGIVLAGISVFFLAGFASTGRALWQGGMNPWQRGYLEIARSLAGQKYPEIGGDLAGSFNAGILGYFSGRRIVNLDGVVNDRILPAMRERRFLGYLREEGVRFVIDHEGLIIEYAIWAEPGYREALRLVARLAKSSFAGDLILVEVRDAPGDP